MHLYICFVITIIPCVLPQELSLQLRTILLAQYLSSPEYGLYPKLFQNKIAS